MSGTSSVSLVEILEDLHEAGFSYQKLARMLDVDKGSVARWRKGTLPMYPEHEITLRRLHRHLKGSV